MKAKKNKKRKFHNLSRAKKIRAIENKTVKFFELQEGKEVDVTSEVEILRTGQVGLKYQKLANGNIEMKRPKIRLRAVAMFRNKVIV